jgi:L-ascorbate metabolism protein UlaG (beta-lactamase superfamily)
VYRRLARRPHNKGLQIPAHFRDGRYFNPGGEEVRGLRDVLKWKLATRPQRSPRMIPVLPSVPPESVELLKLSITMVNHSTVLIQTSGTNFLTDPIWSTHCSPVPFAGPRRHRMPGVEFDNLPSIDTVLLSHNHYDHLDLPTLRRLAKRGVARFVAPLGVAAFLKQHGIGPVRELDWGHSIGLDRSLIHAAPAFHFSGRGLFDRNRTLWCSYVIDTSGGRVFFAGDTAFGPHFQWIREQFGEPRVALLPIGAYQPRWFMKPVHMDPEEAIAAHHFLGAKTSVAIHHGTFQLADDAVDTARERLLACAPPDSFLILDNGQSVLLD